MKTGSLDPVSNRESFKNIRQIIDTETNEAIDLTGASLVFEIRKSSDCGPSLCASTANGKITFVDLYTYEISFTLAEMRCLHPHTYHVGLTFERDDESVQIIAGTLPVLSGEVR